MLIVGGRPGRARGGRLRRLRGLDRLGVERNALGGQLRFPRRIEDSSVSCGDQRQGAREPGGLASAQVRRADHNPVPHDRARGRGRSTSCAARGGAPGRGPSRDARDGHRVSAATGGRSGEYEGRASSTRLARPRRSCAAPVGSVSSGAATSPARPPSRSPAAARSSRSCTGAPTCAEDHVRILGPRARAVPRRRPRSSEIAGLHGTRAVEAVTLTRGERLRFSFLFLFLGAIPCTEWLGETIARAEDGFVLTAEAPASPVCSRRTSPASSPPATCAPAGPSAAPPPSARERWRCSSSTRTSPLPQGSRPMSDVARRPGADRESEGCPVRRRLGGLPAHRRQMAAPADLPHLRACRLLRRLPRIATRLRTPARRRTRSIRSLERASDWTSCATWTRSE